MFFFGGSPHLKHAYNKQLAYSTLYKLLFFSFFFLRNFYKLHGYHYFGRDTTMCTLNSDI